MRDDEWQKFTRTWLKAMLGFQDGTLTMEQAFGLIEESGDSIDEEIEQFACNVVSEIGGFPESYAETIVLLRRNPTMGEVLNYMNS